MKYIDFVVRNKHIESRQNAIIADNTDYMMRFAFDEGWADYPDKTVLVLDNEGKIHELHLTDGATEVRLPKFIGRRLLAVGVTATAGDGEISTDAVSLRVNPSIRTGASEVIESPESGAKDMLEEYRQKYDALIAELQAAIDSTYLGVTGAEVGQTVRITEVDEDGNPVAWEAVDFPEQIQTDFEQTDETAADYLKNRPFGNVAYDGIFFERVPGGYNLVRVPDFNALANIQGSRKAEIRCGGNVVNTGSASVSISDYDGSISIIYISTAGTIINFGGSSGYLTGINVQNNTGITLESEYVLHIDGLYYEQYIKLSADKVEGTLPSASAADCALISTGSGNNWSVTKISTDFPLASATGRGAVKVGDGLSISSDGKLSVDMSGLDTKSLGISGASVGQIVKIKTVDSSGVPTEWEPADMPSGSSGGTDTSLGLTGATVGQIVKIKTVDSSGVPTGWEAADAASGGGNSYDIDLSREPNLVIDVSEAINPSLSISVINGVSLDVTKMAVLLEYPSGGTYTPNYIRWNNSIKNSVDSTAILGNFNVSNFTDTSNAGALLAKIKKINNKTYECEYRWLKQNPGTLIGTGNNVYSNIYRNNFDGNTSIKELYIYQAATIPAGSKISIWVGET